MFPPGAVWSTSGQFHWGRAGKKSGKTTRDRTTGNMHMQCMCIIMHTRESCSQLLNIQCTYVHVYNYTYVHAHVYIYVGLCVTTCMYMYMVWI